MLFWPSIGVILAIRFMQVKWDFNFLKPLRGSKPVKIASDVLTFTWVALMLIYWAIYFSTIPFWLNTLITTYSTLCIFVKIFRIYLEKQQKWRKKQTSDSSV